MGTGQSSTKVWAPLKVLALVVVTAIALSVAGCGILGIRTATEESSSVGAIEPAPYGTSTDQVPGAPELDSRAMVEQQDLAVTGMVPPGAGPDASKIPVEDRLIIRQVDMRLGVDSVSDAVDSIRSATEKVDGAVIDLNISTDEAAPVYRYSEMMALEQIPLAGYVTVRVPADSLDPFLVELEKVGNILREVENQRDVTQEHVDLDARLKNLRSTEAQLRTFMTKAKNVTEMLAVEKELSRIRGEIESMEAQIAYLERQAAHSTVTIELTGPKPVVRPVGEDWGFVAALTESVRAFVRTINTMIVAIGAITPIVLILVATGLIIKVLMRRKRKTVDSASD